MNNRQYKKNAINLHTLANGSPGMRWQRTRKERREFRAALRKKRRDRDRHDRWVPRYGRPIIEALLSDLIRYQDMPFSFWDLVPKD